MDAGKSMHAASTATARRALAETPGFPLTESFQQAGGRRRVGGMEARAQAAEIRFHRCAKLAQLREARVRVAAPSGVSAVVYGVGGAFGRGD